MKKAVEVGEPIELDGRIYSPEEKVLYQNDEPCGSVYVLLDDTEHYNYMRQLKEQKEIAEEAPAEPEVELDLFGEPVLRVNEKLGAGRSRSVGEKMEQKEAWRTAMPGAAVKDVRSAISLNDRVLFIRELFGGDAGLFQKAVDDINAMGSLDEMVAYVNERHPGWDLDSDTVYRLMMAVRRKLSDN